MHTEQNATFLLQNLPNTIYFKSIITKIGQWRLIIITCHQCKQCLVFTFNLALPNLANLCFMITLVCVLNKKHLKRRRISFWLITLQPVFLSKLLCYSKLFSVQFRRFWVQNRLCTAKTRETSQIWQNSCGHTQLHLQVRIL